MAALAGCSGQAPDTRLRPRLQPGWLRSRCRHVLESLGWRVFCGDGQASRAEWDKFLQDNREISGKLENGLLAIKPGGKGNVTATHVLWREKKALPEVPSPLHYRERIYLVRDGGIVTCLEAKTGRLLYRGRLGAGGPYFASPVAGDGKVYAASLDGVVVVFAAGDELKILARNDLDESIAATPALVDGKLYVRTEKHLYAFGE